MAYDLSTLRELFAFSRWANAKSVESVTPLDQEELDRSIGGSFGSVRGTLVHMYGADWVWLERLHGRSPGALPDADELATLDVLRAKWLKVEDARDAYLAKLTPERLAEPLSYTAFDGKSFTRRLGDALFHCANHGTYHRGQIATLVRQLGKKAIPTDFLRWLDAGSPGKPA
jgi:uncharacterized damage-inducible protein DinB